jgi:hypothetical protein
LLIGIGLFECSQAGGPNLAELLDCAPGAQLGRAKLVGGVLGLSFDLTGTCLCFGLAD